MTRGAPAMVLTAGFCAAAQALAQSGGMACNAEAFLGRYDTPGYAHDIAMQGSIAYVADGEAGLQIIEFGDPTAPQFLGALDTLGEAVGIDVEGTVAYISSGFAGVQIIDVSDPTSPQFLRQYAVGASVSNAVVDAGVLYIPARSRGMILVDVSDPANPTTLSTTDIPGFPERITVDGVTAYLMGNPMRVYDVQDPTAPVLLTTWPSNGDCNLHIDGTLGYLSYWNNGTGRSGIQVLDLTNPAAPVLLGQYQDNWAMRQSMEVLAPYGYVARSDGFEILDLSDPTAPTPVAVFRTADACTRFQMVGTVAYLAQRAQGVLTLDTTRWPSDLLIGEVYIDSASYIHDLSVSGDLAFVANGNVGLHVVDVSDPSFPVEIGQTSTGDRARGVAVQDALVYVANSDSGLQIYNSAGGTPTLLGTCNTPGKAMRVAVSGTTVFVADDNSLQIIDATDPAAPTFIGRFTPAGDADAVAIEGTTAYLVGLGTGLVILDVNDPSSPIQLAHLVFPESSPNDITVRDSIAYIAHRTGGLVIVDANDPTNPQLITSIDNSDSAVRVSLENSTVYVAGYSGTIKWYDVSDPGTPRWLAAYQLPASPGAIQVTDGTAYVSGSNSDAGYNKLLLVDVSGCPCPQDLNNDGQVNTLDFLAYLNLWGAGDPLADWNGDGQINTLDFLAYLNDWSTGCP